MSIAAELYPKESPGEELAAKLDAVADRVPYPVDALGPLLGGAARAISETVDAPIVIAAHSVLSVAAFTAC